MYIEGENRPVPPLIVPSLITKKKYYLSLELSYSGGVESDV